MKLRVIPSGPRVYDPIATEELNAVRFLREGEVKEFPPGDPTIIKWLKNGTLLPADEFTAKRAGLSFQKPKPEKSFEKKDKE